MAALAQPLACTTTRAPAQLQRTARASQRVPRRGLVSITAFALPKHVLELKAEGPGSGNRHYPEELHQQYEPRRRMDDGGEKERRHHDMMSSEECYALFPLITHSSVPLRPVEDREPAGLSVLRAGDAGPDTGRRHRPAPAGARRTSLPCADSRPDLQRALLGRHAPELVLQQVRQAQQPPQQV